MSGVNFGKIQGARSEAYQEGRYASDEQRGSLPKFIRPKGSFKMTDFFVAPPHGNVLLLPLRRRALKSVILELLNLTLVRILYS
ncbi:MAG: hypothetical protein HYW78_01400 [Parcubacteria group bacterium]|nr:hypothetical protein [Parcubacteria group bacterium]